MLYEYFFFLEIYINIYAGGGIVEGGVLGVEFNTGFGIVIGLVVGGVAGVVRKRSLILGI